MLDPNQVCRMIWAATASSTASEERQDRPEVLQVGPATREDRHDVGETTGRGWRRRRLPQLCTAR